MPDDSTLLAAYARDRSEEAFGELVRRHLTLVYSAALRRTGGDAHRAQDVAQIVFTVLAREAAALSRHATLTGWLYATTRNAAIDLLRGERRRQQREQKAHAMEEILSAPEPSTDWQQLRPVLDEAMDELDSRDREAVLLRFFEGQPFAGVAAGLRVSEEAARKRVNRALDKLGVLLARRGITSTSGALAVLLASQAGVAAPVGAAASIATVALAGATAGAAMGIAGAGAAGFFIMTTSKAVTGISMAVALAAIGTAVYQANASRANDHTAVALRAERDGLRARVATAEKLAQDSAAKLAAKENEPGAQRPGAPASAATPAALPASSLGPAMDYVLEHPELQPVFVEQQLLRAKLHYDRFFKSSKVTPEQQGQFYQAVEKSLAAELELMAALHTHGFELGTPPKDPSAKALYDKLRGEQRTIEQATQAEIKRLLGDDLFAQYKDQLMVAATRTVTAEMAARLDTTDAPLTAAQADRLSEILRRNQLLPQDSPTPASTMGGTFITPQARSDRRRQVMQQGGLSALDWAVPIIDAALVEAKPLLTPAQFTALQQVQAYQITLIKLAPPPPSSKAPPAGK